MTSIRFIIKSAQLVLQTFIFTTIRQEPTKIFLLPSHIVYVLCFVLLGHVPSLFGPHRCAQTRAATAIPAAIVARCLLRIEHCIVPIAQRLLPTTLCSSLTAHYPLPIAWPGGMRGAIESAALAVRQELACQIQTTSPKLQITSCRSQNPLIISPSAPAHSAGPPPNHPPPDFVIFKKQ